MLGPYREQAVVELDPAPPPDRWRGRLETLPPEDDLEPLDLGPRPRHDDVTDDRTVLYWIASGFAVLAPVLGLLRFLLQ